MVGRSPALRRPAPRRLPPRAGPLANSGPRIAPVAGATPVLEATNGSGLLEAPMLELDGPGRVRWQPGTLRFREAAPVLRVLPGPDNVQVRHVSLLSRSLVSE